DRPSRPCPLHAVGQTTTWRWVELDVQCLEAAQDIQGNIVEPPCPFWSVTGFVEPDFVDPVQNSLNRHATLDSGQRTAVAAVRAAREGDILAGVLPIDWQFGRALEALGVPIRGAGQQHHGGACRQLDPAERGGAGGQPKLTLDRARAAASLRRSSECDRGCGATCPGARGPRRAPSARWRAVGPWSRDRR